MVFEGVQTVSSSNLIISQSSTEVSLVQRVLWILNTLYNQILAIFTVLLLWIFFENYDKKTSFFWHLLLSTAAYVPLMAAAIILFSEDNLISIYIRRTKRYWIHGILLTISCVAVTIGISVETNSKNKGHRAHLKSNHAILGAVSWLLVVLAVIIGLLAAKGQKFASFIRPVITKFIHNVLGIAGFAIGMASLYLELTAVERATSKHVYYASKWAVWYITIWSLLAAFKSLWSQLKSIFS